MDHVEQELSRIIKLAERKLVNVNWSQGFSHADDVIWSSEPTLSCYFSSRLKHDNSCGDTDLHWILGTHAPVSAIENFLEMKRRHEQLSQASKSGEPPSTVIPFENLHCPSSIDSQTARGATPLHVAVYRNSWYAESIVKLLTASKPSKEVGLASIPMSCGSYPLHVLCGHNMTIQDGVLNQLLSADPSVVLKDDVNGDNPFSLLWKNVLRFRWAISKEKGHKDIDYFDGGLSWMTIIAPDQYLSYSLQMMKALRIVMDLSGSEQPGKCSIHEICAIPRCPPLLLRLAMTEKYKLKFGISGDAYSLDRNGMLPLHHAVQNPVANERFVPPYFDCKLQSVVEILLDEYPESVTVADNYGRIPLHYALQNGRLEEDLLLVMIQLYPESLRLQDPVSGLYPFMLVASKTDEIPKAFPGGGKGSSSKPAEWKQSIVSMSYVLLQICPEVVQFHHEPPASSLLGR